MRQHVRGHARAALCRFMAPVSVGLLCRLTSDVSCQSWGTDALHGAVGEFEHCGGATFVVGPLSRA
jgi:hypothetical protein